MDITLAVHIITGVMGIVFGFVALYSKKGGPQHRRIGMMFVYVMVIMALTGIWVSAMHDVARSLNIPIATLTAYLVVSSVATVKPALAKLRWLNIAGLLVALSLFVADFYFGASAIARGGLRDEIPAFMFFMFGVIALLAAIGDVRVIRSGPLQGRPRLARHLWRMTFALAVAALSFFIGQGQVFPEPLRSMGGLRALPVLAVLATLFYWLWRARPKRRRLLNDDYAVSLRTSR